MSGEIGDIADTDGLELFNSEGTNGTADDTPSPTPAPVKSDTALASVERPDGTKIELDLTGDDAGSERDPLEDPKRVEYWQSRADKLGKKLKEVESVIPLADHLNKNPKLIEAIEETLRKSAVPEIKAPVAPEKPSGFSRAEALSNPESASAKYLEEMDRFRDEQIAYLGKKDEQRESMLRQQAEAFQREQAEKRAAQQLKAEVQAKHGLSAAEAQEFIDLMSDPKLTTYHMVQLYKLQKGVKPSVGRPQMGPMPITGIRSGVPTKVDDADLFNAGMLSWKRKN